ncbi:MAG TPA: Gfo/Idh/MocA family oxidoreductase, partial [Roseimicrobium sp.]|nr:Gfo/Idh/MocA family oxidoreductase [Roseimicrobium sp.]
MSLERAVHAAGTDEIKVALVGCGGRGSGAADQALTTYNQGGIKLVAVADVHEDRMLSSLSNLRKQHPDRVDVPPDRQFMGFDGYKKAIAAADIVILATPPGFRPMQIEEAVRQGKNIFTEKPVCVDAAGFRKVMAAAKVAKEKNLKVGVGLQRRHQAGYLETIKRIHDGAIGDVVSMRAYWNGNTPWVKPRADLEKQYNKKLTEMEYQLRNWYYFVWLCGDHITEQHIHNLDVINWIKKGPPVKARGMGGVETRKGPDYGEIFDHHSVEFTYADGSICHSMCRHQLGCWNEVTEFALGTKGKSELHRYIITGENKFRHENKGDKNPYQQEHDDLFEAIRKNTPYNELEYGATSSMTSVLGRLATYSGKEVEWDAAIQSPIETMVKNIDKVSF